MIAHPYLKNKKVRIESIPSPEKWKEHFGNLAKDAPEVLSNLKSKPFQYPNTVKGFCVPSAATGVIRTLDSTKKHKCPDMQDQELTEEEYFSKVYNVDLNPFLTSNNFWTNGNNSAAFPTMRDGVMLLDLSTPEGYIQFRVLTTHYKDEIAGSPEELKTRRLGTYLYVVRDASAESNDSNKSSDILMDAAIKCKEIIANKETILKFLACAGRNMDEKQDIEALAKPVKDMMREDPEIFLKVANDPKADLKYLIVKARKAKIIKSHVAKDLLILPKSGKEGKFDQVVEYLSGLDQEDEVNDLIYQVENKIS